MDFIKAVGLNRLNFKFFRLRLCPIMHHKVFLLIAGLQIGPFGAWQLQAAEAIGRPRGMRRGNSDSGALFHISLIAQILSLIQVMKKQPINHRLVGLFGEPIRLNVAWLGVDMTLTVGKGCDHLIK